MIKNGEQHCLIVKCEMCLIKFSFGEGNKARIGLDHNNDPIEIRAKCPECGSHTPLPLQFDPEKKDWFEQ